jgi:hypothetical protein
MAKQSLSNFPQQNFKFQGITIQFLELQYLTQFGHMAELSESEFVLQ